MMYETELIMTGILGSMIVFIAIVCQYQTMIPINISKGGNWLPTVNNLAKRDFEIWSLKYTGIWIGIFGIVVVKQLYEQFDENGYMALCSTLALPFLLQPILGPTKSERMISIKQRYSFKANLWIAIFSFIGNYWYTHYFYTVLKAKYTFPGHRLNDVPIALFFATHFYFITYHTFSNLLLRKIETRYAPSLMRNVLFWSVVVAFAYFTAFMETLTISSFPYYKFGQGLKEDRDLVYTLGSAFYGIYFLISFPVFYKLDEYIGKSGTDSNVIIQPYSIYQTIIEAMGTSMIVLLLLDFARILLGIELNISGVAYYLYKP